HLRRLVADALCAGQGAAARARVLQSHHGCRLAADPAPGFRTFRGCPAWIELDGLSRPSHQSQAGSDHLQPRPCAAPVYLGRDRQRQGRLSRDIRIKHMPTKAEQVVDAFFSAMENLEHEKVDKLYADNATIWHSFDDKTVGKDEIVNNVRNMKQFATLSFK